MGQRRKQMRRLNDEKVLETNGFVQVSEGHWNRSPWPGLAISARKTGGQWQCIIYGASQLDENCTISSAQFGHVVNAIVSAVSLINIGIYRSFDE